MAFLNTSLLIGAFLVALPIVLHLIMRQRPKYLRFPALRFIQKRKEANRRKLQLRHWLLLALRCVAIGLLALALARPSVTGTGAHDKENAPIAAALVFDASPRMDYRHENLTRLETAQQLADWLLSRLPPETAVGVLDSATAQRIFAVDHGAAQQQIARLATSPASRPLQEAVVEAIHLVRSKPEHRHEVYVFTDLSVAAWDQGALRSISAALGEDADVNLYVVDVGTEQPRNVGVGAVRLTSDVISQAVDISLQVEFSRIGSESGVEAVLFVEDDSGELQARGRKPVEWQEDSGSSQFLLTGLAEGTHQGLVRIPSQDALAIDNQRHFTIEVRPPPAVLLLAADDREAIFLSETLAPKDFVKQGRARFRCDVVRFDQATGQSLASYAAVCLLDPPRLAPAFWDSLASYAAEGGGVAIFLGHHANRDALNAEEPQALLAAPLVRVWRESVYTYLSPDAYNHPALARLGRYRTAVPWQGLPVYKLWQLADELNAGAATIIPFANGLPAVLERSVGNGRAVTMTTPVSHAPSQRNTEPWNLLPVGDSDTDPWPYLALMNDLVGYLAGTGEHRLNYLSGETATLTLSQPERLEVQQKNGYVVFTPGGDAVQRTMRAGEDTVVFAATDRPGNYRVAAGGRSGALKRGFSVNLPAGTSALARAKPERIAAALGEDRVHFARERDEIEVSVGLGRVGRELFPWMIGVLVVILAGEHVVANRFYRE